MTDTNDLRQQPALPDIETRIPTAAEVDERTGNVSSREYRGGFNDCRLVFAQPTIDRLQSALAAAQRRIATLGQQPSQLGSGEVKRYVGCITELEPCPVQYVVLASDFDRLQSALTATRAELTQRKDRIGELRIELDTAQHGAAMWEREYRIEHGRVERLTGELLAARQRIAELEKTVDELRADRQ